MPNVSHVAEDVLNLSAGDVVRVRSAAEIFRTLDAQGSFDNLPFMPEMLRYCGQTLRVYKRADKTCDAGSTLLRMRNTVHLTEIRCDGSGHDGCQAGCLTFWKEAWLQRAGAEDAPSAPALDGDEQAFVEQTLLPATLKNSSARPEDRVYRCQATEIPQAGTPLRPWMVDQYPRDVRSWGVPKVARGLAIYAFNKYQVLGRDRLPHVLLIQGGETYPFLRGKLEKAPSRSVDLDLQPGDVVRIRSKEEILATLDRENKNKGLLFDVEMLPYCGTTARVRSRVDRLIDEHNGKMIKIKRDCYILDGVMCKADFHRFCTRAIYSYWRSVWLDKVS